MKRNRLPLADRWRRWLILLGCLGLTQHGPFAPPLLSQEEEDAAGEAAPEEEDEADDELEEEEEEEVVFPNWLGGSTDYFSWVDVSAAGVFVDGNQAEFQRRNGLNAGAFGGVNEVYWEKFVGDNGLFSVSGFAILGNEDYGIRLNYSDSEKGSLRAGYRHYRIWYNGSGGYYSPTDAWFPLADNDLYIDRGRFWIEGTLTLPNLPIFSLEYSHEYRDGRKSSTIWGPTASAGGRGITASFRDVDEVRDIIKLDAEDTFGNTEAGIGVRYDRSEIDNALNTRTDAGRPSEYYTTQKDGTDTDLFSVHATSDTRFSEQWMLTTGYAFTTVETALSGSRVFGANYDPIYDPALARGPGFLDLTGGSRLNQHVVSLNLPYRPTKTFVLVPSVRFESVGLDSDSFYRQTPAAASFRSADSNKDYLDLSQRLEARYSGFSKWVLYGRGDWAQRDGDLQERLTTLNTGTIVLDRDTDFDEFTQKYTAGANWYPMQRMNFSMQYYYKLRDNGYDHNVDSTPNNGALRYPAYLTSQDFDTHDVNFRVTLRPMNNLTSVSRYDYQMSTIETAGNNASAIESADIDTHIFSQSLTWSPLSRLYFQGTASYVVDRTQTPATDDTSVAGLVPESKNDYWQLGLATGYVIDNRTDVEAEYLFYKADNLVDNSSVSQPYGAEFQEHRAFITMSRRIHEHLRVLLRYGYFQNDDETYGGFNDYKAHLVYSSLQYRW